MTVKQKTDGRVRKDGMVCREGKKKQEENRQPLSWLNTEKIISHQPGAAILSRMPVYVACLLIYKYVTNEKTKPMAILFESFAK